jgi:hypothetical protein
MSRSRTLAARRLVAALTAALALGESPGRGQEPVSLRWRFHAGDTIRYEFRQKNEIKVKTGNQESVNTTDLTLKLTWRVDSVAEDGTARVSQSLDHVRVTIQPGTQTIRFVSDGEGETTSPEAQALGKVYRAAIAAPASLTIDRRGRVVEARVAESVTRAVRGSPFQAAADSGSLFSGQGLKSLLAQVIPVLPEKSVAQGSRWEQSLDLPSPPLVLTLKDDFTLAKLDEGVATLDARVAAAISTDPVSSVRVDLKKGSGSATFRHDVRAGRQAEASLRQSLEMDMTFGNRNVAEVVTVEASLKLIP